MPTVLQLRRGTTAEHSTFTGAEGEVTVNTTKDTIVVHDGSTQGGFEVALADATNLNGVEVSNFDAAAIQTGSESFTDSDTVLMTAAAVQDKIESYGYITSSTADISSVTAGDGLSGGGSSGDVTLTVDLTDTNSFTTTNTASKAVVRDASGDFAAGTITADLTGNVTGDVTGNADTATTLATARTIGGVSFDGSANINLPGVNTTGNQDTTGAAATLTSLTATVTELNYVDGVTSNIQTQLDAKLASSSVSAYGLTLIDDADAATARTTLGLGTAATTASTDYATAAQGALADSAIQNLGDLSITATAAEINKLDGVTATTTELNYVDGVTSAIQTQLDAKAPSASPTFTGTATLPTVDINAGNIDGTTIGASSAAAGTFTTISTSGNATIGGNLTVSGTTTTVNSNEVNIGDAVILLNSDETGTPSQNAGIEVERGTSTNKSLVWNETSDKWTVGSDTFVAGTFEGNVTGDLTGDVTGNVTGNVTGSSGSTTGNAATATALETARTIGGVSFDGTANINLPGVNTTGNQDTSGNAATASAWATARTLSLTGAVTGSASVDGSGNVSLATTATSDPTLTLSGDASGSATFTNLGNATLTVTVADDSHNHVTSNIDGLAEYIADTVGAMVTSNTETGITVTYDDTDNTLDFVVGTLNQDTTGNAATATALETARTIAGQSFDGTANISIAPTDLTGVTATAAEINKLDGVTATTTELNYVDGVTSAIQTQLDAKAPSASPTFTGTPTAPTATAGANTTQIATTAFVATAVANVIDSAPGALDTLNELAAALGDDANFSTTVTNSIATKLNSSAVSAFGLTLVDDADAATARTTLGLGTAATTASTDYATAAQGTLADSAVQNLADLSITATATEINKLDGVTATTTELNYVDGVTSAIQTQLDAKLASSSYTASDVLTKIKTVDGTGSGLDADTLDGNQATAFATAAQGALADSAVQNLSDLSITATATEINKLDGVTATTAELNYVDGVTSNIQTQLNAKQATITGAATTIDTENLTASRALVSNGSGKVAVSAVTSTEIGYLDGVTSSIQTQINNNRIDVYDSTGTLLN